MDNKNAVRDFVLVVVILLLIWYLFRADSRRSRIAIGSASVTGRGNAAGTGPVAGCCCGGNATATAPATSSTEPERYSPGGGSLNGSAGYGG
jgi:hypothetical protein